MRGQHQPAPAAVAPFQGDDIAQGVGPHLVGQGCEHLDQPGADGLFVAGKSGQFGQFFEQIESGGGGCYSHRFGFG